MEFVAAAVERELLKFQMPPKNKKARSAEEDAKIREMAPSHSVQTIAKALGRSVGAIHGRASALGMKVSHKAPKIRD